MSGEERADRAAAVATIVWCRQTHVEWVVWLRSNPDDPRAAVAGTLDHHQRVIREYDNVLAVLEAGS